MAVPPEVLVEIDPEEAQRIYIKEEHRVGAQDLSVFFNYEDPADLEGEPLSLKEVKKLYPNWFVKTVLYQVSGHAKDNAPLKTTNLKHKGLARILLTRFIQKERAMPNNHQIAIYFIQQTYIQDILQRRVNWDDRPKNAEVGKGRPREKARA